MSVILEKSNTTFDIKAVSQQQWIHPRLDDKVMPVFQLVIFACVCQAIVVFGIVTNIINIICFIKQGFTDAVNVSLLGLAISDLCCLVTLIWTNICFTPAFTSLDLPFDPIEFQYLISGTPHITFTRVTAWITALITLERCLCITVPLKVKNIVTSKRVAILITCVFIILLSSVAPVYVISKLKEKYFPQRNKTILGVTFAENRVYVERICFAINNVTVPFIAFIVIIVCTTILVVKLHRNTQWRKISTTAGKADNASNRNMKVAKMVVMISILFIVCFILVSSMFLGMAIEPQLSLDGPYRDIGILLGGFGLVFESINSSTNIFIYYSMSTKYSVAFRQLFRVTVPTYK